MSMKFGAVFPQTEIGTDPAVIRDFARSIEQAGYDYLLAYDHVLGAHPERFEGPIGGFPSAPYTSEHPFHEVFTLFSFLAGVTERLEFATSVLILPQRQTALAAKQAAAVALLSQGRLRLAVGVGWNFAEYEGLGEDFRSRGRRIEEQVRLLRMLWTQPLVTFHGAYHHLERVGINPLPVRPIPLWLGSGASDRSLRRAARLGDGWMPLLQPGEDLAEALPRLRAFLEDEGRDPRTFGVDARVYIGRGGDPDSWLAQVHTLQSLGITHLAVVTGRAGRPAPWHVEMLMRFRELLRDW